MPLFACQNDASLRALDTTLLRCEPTEDGLFIGVTEDTVLYPEGGGQPADRGTLDGVAVLDAQKVDGEVVLTLAAAVAPGPVRMEVDWARRFDLMQQHSAQHLISAIAQDRFGRATTAFHLGAQVSSVDLDGATLSEAERLALQSAVNAAIVEARPVQPRLFAPDAMPANARSRLIPDDLDGPLRLIEIEGYDLNTCGGTHVSNTARLQAVVLTRIERYKGGSRLSFVAGGRVVAGLDAATQREQALSRLLTCSVDEQHDAVQHLVDGRKEAGKVEKALRAELAGLMGAALRGRPGDAVGYHQDDADLRTLQQVAASARDAGEARPMLLTGDGCFLIDGDEALVRAKGPQIAAALEGRGGGARGRYQGKAARVDRRDEALALLTP
ncbi:MAG: alanyl-tRNA editing protein [Alphaproteobacteria bacterium]|nr:alanyl-tRNA editing protein [Alphaproteobacteria bacterium]